MKVFHILGILTMTTTVASLKAELTKRGLPVTGNKSVLMERLQNELDGGN